MREIDCAIIAEKTAELCGAAANILPCDVETALRAAVEREKSPLGSAILADCVKNAEIARNDGCPICQDTGFAVFFVELGADIRISSGLLEEALTEGTRRGYDKFYLRKSIVADPIFDRTNTGDNTPPVIHLSIVPGDRIRIVLAPKGGGSENMSAVAMLKPSQGRNGVVDFVVDTVVKAGGNPCPPVIVGVGVGGTFEKCAILSKKALLREVGSENQNPDYAALERELLERINNSGVGPQGLGGKTTALAVHIEPHPCHIASLPVAVNLNCHAARHAEIII